MRQGGATHKSEKPTWRVAEPGEKAEALFGSADDTTARSTRTLNKAWAVHPAKTCFISFLQKQTIEGVVGGGSQDLSYKERPRPIRSWRDRPRPRAPKSWTKPQQPPKRPSVTPTTQQQQHPVLKFSRFGFRDGSLLSISCSFSRTDPSIGADMSKWLAVAALLVAMCMVGESGASETACLSGIALRGSGAVKERGYSVVRGCSVVEGRMLRLRGGEDEEEAGGEEDAADAGMAGDEDVEEEEEEEEEEVEGMNMNKAVKQVALSTHPLPPRTHIVLPKSCAERGAARDDLNRGGGEFDMSKVIWGELSTSSAGVTAAGRPCGLPTMSLHDSSLLLLPPPPCPLSTLKSSTLKSHPELDTTSI